MPEFMKFPPLYKKTSTGADQTWEIHTENNVIVTTWGQVGGKMQTGRDVISQGKNVGKANETSPKQQAQMEAQSQWEKKLKKGYVATLGAARAGEVDDLIEGGIFPMLAHKFNEQGHKIKYPAFAQPKFDGHRCIAMVKDGKATLWSRTRKPITGLPHIVKALEELCEVSGSVNFALDGELYRHDYRDRFEELTSFVRNPEPKAGSEVVQFHIYDFPDPEYGFDIRIGMVHDLLGYANNKILVPVSTERVKNEEELAEFFEHCIENGYEGAMVRNSAGKYVNKRSYDLQKVKEMVDDEFLITGVEEGRGKLAGHAIFVCKTKEGKEFRVKMKGETAALKTYFENPKSVIGKYLTVQYQGLTADGILRFPVGLRFFEGV